MRRAGDERLPDQAIGGPGLKCNALGCIAHLRGVLVAVDARAEALAEDCAKASVVISVVPAHRFCTGPRLVIDRRDAAQDGAHAIWLGANIRVENVEDQRGLRPWTARYQRLIRHQ